MSKFKSSRWMAAALLATIAVPTIGAAQDAAPVVDDKAAAKAAKAAAKAAEKERRAQEAAERKRLAALRRQYGEGPYPDEIDAYLADKPEALKPLYRTLFTGGERNAVLNFQRLGLAAMDRGLWSDAERSFDAALTRIEAVYAKNKQAEAARDTFRKEANKDFKGEPYERAMAYYYRGLLYLRAGDYDNARASFRTAEYQDTISEAEEFKSDFAVMNYLVGWTYHCQNQPSMAEEAFGFATEAQPGLTAPGSDDRLLMVAEYGHSPMKARAGAQSEKMIFEASPQSAETAARFELGDTAAFDAVPASSVYYQATTRGGRAIDAILNGKAEFKATTGAVGDALTTSSLVSMASGNLDSGTLGLAGAGMLLSLFASAAKTEADIRMWDTLPDMITVATAKAADPGKLKAARVDYLTGTETVATKAPIMAAANGSCAILWSRSRAEDAVSADVPGEDSALAAKIARRKDIQQRDKAFRVSLLGH